MSAAEVVEPDAATIEVVTKEPLAERQKTDEELAQIRLQNLEDELYEESAFSMQALQRFAEIDPEATEPPPGWFAKYKSEADGWRAFRMAKEAWKSSKDVAFAMQANKSILASIIKARSTASAAPKVLNVVAISVTSERRYEEKEVE